MSGVTHAPQIRGPAGMGFLCPMRGVDRGLVLLAAYAAAAAAAEAKGPGDSAEPAVSRRVFTSLFRPEDAPQFERCE